MPTERMDELLARQRRELDALDRQIEWVFRAWITVWAIVLVGFVVAGIVAVVR